MNGSQAIHKNAACPAESCWPPRYSMIMYGKLKNFSWTSKIRAWRGLPCLFPNSSVQSTHLCAHSEKAWAQMDVQDSLISPITTIPRRICCLMVYLPPFSKHASFASLNLHWKKPPATRVSQISNLDQHGPSPNLPHRRVGHTSVSTVVLLLSTRSTLTCLIHLWFRMHIQSRLNHKRVGAGSRWSWWQLGISDGTDPWSTMAKCGHVF
jgi:hypothetical protein